MSKKKKLVKQKKRRFLKPSLWFSARKVEVQAVKKAHKVVCCVCEKVPKERRLVVVDGAGRNSTTRVFCDRCGYGFLAAMERECHRASNVLIGASTDPIRLEKNGSGDLGKEFLKRKVDERKRKKQDAAG